MNKFVKRKGGSDGTPGEHESVSLQKDQADNDHVCEKPPPKKRKFDPGYTRYGFTVTVESLYALCVCNYCQQKPTSLEN